MKILFNTYSTAFQHPGGGEVIILKLKQYLEDRGHEVTLFNMWEHKFKDFDLVHQFSLLSWKDWNYLKCNGIKFVVTPTTWPKKTFTTSLKSNVKKLLGGNYQYFSLENFLSFPKFILPTTSLEMEKIKDYYQLTENESFEIFPNGVDPIKSVVSEKNIFIDEYKNQDYLLFVGDIAPNKGVERAIRMAKNANKSLFIVGGLKKENEKYFDEIKLMLSDRIQYIGRLETGSKILSDAYRGANAVLIPSDFETCSLVGLEAGIQGTPIVITQNGGTKEVFKSYAHYCDPADMNSCFIALENALEKKGQDFELQKHIGENYTWDKLTEKLEKIYQRALS